MLIFHWIHSLWWPETGQGYAIGSSWAGANFGFITIWYIMWRRHNCQKSGCPRIGRTEHEQNGHHRLYCHRHLPAADQGSATDASER